MNDLLSGGVPTCSNPQSVSSTDSLNTAIGQASCPEATVVEEGMKESATAA